MDLLIKQGTIGIDKDDEIKLFNFEHSVKLDSEYNMDVFTILIFFMPPKYIKTKSLPLYYDGDWWSLGITLYMILEENNHPYYSYGPSNDVESISDIILENIKNENMRPMQNKNLPQELKDLILYLFIHPDEAKRLGTNKDDALKIASHTFSVTTGTPIIRALSKKLKVLIENFCFFYTLGFDWHK